MFVKMKQVKNKYGRCGHECSACIVFRATQSRTKKAKEKAASALNKVLGRNYKPEDIHCTGCQSADNAIFKYSINCFVRDCCMIRGLDFCSECEDYPCSHVGKIQSDLYSECMNIKGKYPEKLFKEVCHAFIHSKENLRAPR
jgi:hypothetical protein